jgi:hypothetical protein
MRGREERALILPLPNKGEGRVGEGKLRFDNRIIII